MIVQDGFYDAFKESGCNLHIFDYMHHYINTKNIGKIRIRFVEEISKIKPDLLFMQIQHTNIIDATSIVQAKKNCPKMVVVNWTGDVRNMVPVTYKRVGQVSDWNLISSTGQLPMFRQVLNNVHYLQIGYNPKLYHADNQRDDFRFDALFAGNYNSKEKYPGTEDRTSVCKLLESEFGSRFGLYGHGWPKEIKTRGSAEQRTISDLYKQSVCSISVSHYNDIDHYFSDRLLMCMASGRPCVSLRFPQCESYFTNMCDVVVVDNINQIPEKIRMLKAEPELAKFIGEQGAAKVFAEHTYYSRVQELLTMTGFI